MQVWRQDVECNFHQHAGMVMEMVESTEAAAEVRIYVRKLMAYICKAGNLNIYIRRSRSYANLWHKTCMVCKDYKACHACKDHKL